MLSKYKGRLDSLEKIVSSHYAKMIRTGGKVRSDENSNEKGPDGEEFEDNSETEDDVPIDSEDPEYKFHFIITEDDELGDEIPPIFKLKETLPRENPIMQ